MNRLCERPGCSEVASLTYGMRPEELIFWVDVLRETADTEAGVLCLRHGDSMTLPRGWTLDDLRDPDLHLFRPPARSSDATPRRARSRSDAGNDETGQDETGQLELDGLAAIDWKPAFEDGDDLDGLLAARSPLLSRAFRGERGD